MTVEQLEKIIQEIEAEKTARLSSTMPLGCPRKVTGAFKSKGGGVVAPRDKSISTGFLGGQDD